MRLRASEYLERSQRASCYAFDRGFPARNTRNENPPPVLERLDRGGNFQHGITHRRQCVTLAGLRE
jgi:hypothetical protein